jgi:hypothetical protein
VTQTIIEETTVIYNTQLPIQTQRADISPVGALFDYDQATLQTDTPKLDGVRVAPPLDDPWRPFAFLPGETPPAREITL